MAARAPRWLGPFPTERRRSRRPSTRTDVAFPPAKLIPSFASASRTTYRSPFRRPPIGHIWHLPFTHVKYSLWREVISFSCHIAVEAPGVAHADRPQAIAPQLPPGFARRMRVLASASSYDPARGLAARIWRRSAMSVSSTPQILTARTAFESLRFAGWVWTGTNGHGRAGQLNISIQKEKVDPGGPVQPPPAERGRGGAASLGRNALRPIRRHRLYLTGRKSRS